MTSKFRIVLQQSILLVLFFCSCPVPANDDGEDLVQVIAHSTKAVAIKHDPPVYPNKALRHETEGWVVLRFIVKEDGTTDDIVVISSSIENYFEKAAISAVSAWTNEPATRNGEPVIQYNTDVRTIFKIQNLGEGVSKSFRFIYNDAIKAMREGDLEKAEIRIAKLKSNKKRWLSEVCYLDILESTYFRNKGDYEASLVHLERALVIADEVTTNDMHIALLRQAIAEQANAQNYRAAMRYFNTLLEVNNGLAPDDPVFTLAESIKQAINSDEALVTNGTISQCDHHCGSSVPRWHHALNRNRVAIDQVDGKVTEVEILCGNHSISLAYNLDVVWDINKDWGECDILVAGDIGTSFRLIELPKAN